jgi:uncharacterized repeat protein (TIGR03803 family)
MKSCTPLSSPPVDQGRCSRGADENFYVATSSGGSGQRGAILKITPSGAMTVLHAFSFDGANPQASLVQGSDGGLYGTAPNGGLVVRV